jgi:hypothetical protein
MKKHIEAVGILHILYHSLGLIAAAAVLIFVAGGGLITGDEFVIALTSALALFISFIILIFSIPGVIGGIALLKMKQWGRILTLILGFLALLEIPFGTALGIYTIWVLMKDETIKMFDGESKSRATS